ncbi:hypothetical protein FVE85_5940 [Porphyridium purpureum]|uniref:Uncharacterized protein n=1 Tax=Porphyridium purpureum TaxID=35688 RepID=A0A5J4Z4V9_PORPP|nr:hypothetical protein FVE85_5940 [Porphyridium purpureum]|eukprot:POR3199..scf295_1
MFRTFAIKKNPRRKSAYAWHRAQYSLGVVSADDFRELCMNELAMRFLGTNAKSTIVSMLNGSVTRGQALGEIRKACSSVILYWNLMILATFPDGGGPLLSMDMSEPPQESPAVEDLTGEDEDYVDVDSGAWATHESLHCIMKNGLRRVETAVYSFSLSFSTSGQAIESMRAACTGFAAHWHAYMSKYFPLVGAPLFSVHTSDSLEEEVEALQAMICERDGIASVDHESESSGSEGREVNNE